MVVALFSDSYAPYVSGVVRSIALTARELVRRGHTVCIVAPAYPDHATSGTDAATGARIVRLPSVPAPGQPVFRLPVPAGRLLHRFLKTMPPDVIHAHSPFVTGRMALSASAAMGAPVVFTHHTLYHEYVHYALLPRALVVPGVVRTVGRFCRRVSAVVAPTATVARMVPALYGRTAPVTVIPTGLDLSAFQQPPCDHGPALGIPGDAPVVVHVGRLAPEKNVETLMSAMRLILVASEKTHALVVGGGPWYDRHARDGWLPAELRPRLHLVGPVEPGEVPRYLACADLFLTASTTETQGLVAVEAMAAGLPVVGPAAGGLPDVVQDGADGILTRPEAEMLAAGVLDLLADPDRLEELSAHARTSARRFDVTRTVTDLEELYVKLSSQAL